MNDASLSQDEINALLQGADDMAPAGDAGIAATPSNNQNLTPDEEGKLQEIGDISASSNSSAISAVSGKDVKVSLKDKGVKPLSEIVTGFPANILSGKISYSSPIAGDIFILIKGDDATVLASEIGGADIPELNEMAISTLQEAMNQIFSSRNTAIGQKYSKTLTSNNPKLSAVDAAGSLTIPEGSYVFFEYSIILGKLNSSFYELCPISLYKEIIKQGDAFDIDSSSSSSDDLSSLLEGSDIENSGSVNVQPAQFGSLDSVASVEPKGNISLLMDVPMQLTVELGRTKKIIKEILTLGEGSIIELDKLAGEPVDILVNQKLIARGEVVVIDENFGVRVTDIVNPKDRIAAART